MIFNKKEKYQELDFEDLDSEMLKLLEYGRNSYDNKIEFYMEEFETLSGSQEKEHIEALIDKTDILLDDLIENPINGTDSDRWKYVKQSYKRDIKGLSLIEEYLEKQFAYTVNKGEKVRLCLCDKDGELDEDLNMYVLMHELTHIYDKRYLTSPSKHDKYFWTLFSKIITRATELKIFDQSIFMSNKKRCNTDILRTSDLEQIERFSRENLPKV